MSSSLISICVLRYSPIFELPMYPLCVSSPRCPPQGRMPPENCPFGGSPPPTSVQLTFTCLTKSGASKSFGSFHVDGPYNFYGLVLICDLGFKSYQAPQDNRACFLLHVLPKQLFGRAPNLHVYLSFSEFVVLRICSA